MLSDKLQNRFYFYLYPLPIAIVGCFVFMFTDSFGAKYFSLFLLNFSFASFGTQFAWISNSIPRPPAKRTVALAFSTFLRTAIPVPILQPRQQEQHR